MIQVYEALPPTIEDFDIADVVVYARENLNLKMTERTTGSGSLARLAGGVALNTLQLTENAIICLEATLDDGSGQNSHHCIA